LTNLRDIFAIGGTVHDRVNTKYIKSQILFSFLKIQTTKISEKNKNLIQHHLLHFTSSISSSPPPP
jgi:hypothetical protein